MDTSRIAPDIENALATLEAAKAAGRLSPELQERIDALGSVRSDVEGALSGAHAPAESASESAPKREISPEQADRLIATLESRFDAADPKLRKAIQWGDVEKRLRANPEALYSLQKLEETGGEP